MTAKRPFRPSLPRSVEGLGGELQSFTALEERS
jgi:hypothetical protein